MSETLHAGPAPPATVQRAAVQRAAVPRARRRAVHVILPGGIDDPANPSGGNAYDRRVCTGLTATGWAVHEHQLTGAWPQPDSASRETLRRVLAGVPDDSAVLVDGLVACGVPDAMVEAAHRLRLVVLLHLPLGDELGRPPALATALAAREGQTLRAVAAVVATSGWAARRVIELYGLDPRRVHVATPGVDPAPPATGTDGESRLLCVGAVTPTKGQDLLVDALSGLADRAWSCDLIGPLHRAPEHVAEVRAAIDGHGLDGRVRLIGPLAPDRLATAYDRADLLVLPSRAETYGMVVTEALARGIPVLAADTGGVADTLGTVAGARDRTAMSPLTRPHEPTRTAMSPLTRPRAGDGDGDLPNGGIPGLLMPPGDVDALAGGLRRWFDDPDLRAGLRRSAALRREELTGWEVTSRCLEQVLDGLSRS